MFIEFCCSTKFSKICNFTIILLWQKCNRVGQGLGFDLISHKSLALHEWYLVTSNLKKFIFKVAINRHGWLRKLTPVVNKMRRVET